MRRGINGLLFGLGVGLAGALFLASPFGMAIEERLGLAWLFHLRGPEPPPREAAIVAIDERSAIDLGLPKAPREWPRSLHGQLVDALVARGAELVVFDLAFSRPQPAEADQAFADAIARAGRVLLFETIERRVTQLSPSSEDDVVVETFGDPITVLREAALGIAPLPLPNVPTRISRFWTFLGNAGDRVTLPALALTALALRHDRAWPQFSPGWVNPLGPDAGEAPRADGRVRIDLMARALRRHVKADFRLDTLPPPADDEGRRLRTALVSLYSAADSHYLNFYGPPGTIRHLGYAQVLACRDRTDPPCDIDLHGAVVFVGLSELGKPPDFERDAFPTVFSRPDGVYLSGVEIAATAFANLLTDCTLRPLPLSLAVPLVLLLGTAFGLAAALLPPQTAAPSTLLLGVSYAVAAQLLFAHPGLWLPLATPLVGQLPVALIGGIGGQLLLARRQARDLQQAKTAAEAASAAKSEALRIASHDIRTPVQAMVGYLEQLRATRLDPGQHALLDQLLAASDALLGMLNAVLDLAAIDAGKLRIVEESVDLRRFTPGVVDIFRADAARKGLAMMLSISPDVPPSIRTDPLRLRQVLANLLANAIKFTDRGQVTLDVTPSEDASRAPAVAFAVADTGIGIDAEALAGLFRPFSRGSAEAARRPGSGLGLSISQRLAELMGGSIRVDSQPGVGSTFRLLLPAALPWAEEAALRAEVAQPAIGWGLADRKPGAAPRAPKLAQTVLIVEDDPAIRALLERQLADLGLTVSTAGDGLSGWKHLQETPVDLLLTDYRLPGLEGPALIRRARADDRFAALRIVGLSADIAAEVEDAFIAAGADVVLAKPVTAGQLASALHRIGVNAIERTIGGAPLPVPPAIAGVSGDGALQPVTDDVPSWPVFDAANIYEAIGRDPARLRLVAEAFIRQTEALVSELAQAAEQRDGATVGRIAHRVAGSSLSFGAIRLGETCREIERLAAADDWETISRLVAAMPESSAAAAAACRQAVKAADDAAALATQESTS